MMKALSAGRKVYVRNDVVHIIAKGRQYGPQGTTQVDVKGEVAVGDVSETSVTVTQGTVQETWNTVNVPSTPRKPKAQKEDASSAEIA